MNFIKFFVKQLQFKETHRRITTDFFVDSLSSSTTAKLILFLLSLVTVKDAVQQSIHCWVPKEFTRYSKFITKLCWLNGTYYLPLDKYGNVVEQYYYNDHPELQKDSVVTYYLWIQILLVLQAFSFYFPYMMWNFISSKSGYDLYNIVIAAKKFDKSYNDPAENLRILNYLVSTIKQAHSDIYSKNSKLKSRNNNILEKSLKSRSIRSIIFLNYAYTFIKIVYLANCIAQLYLVNKLLEQKSVQKYTNSSGFNLIDIIYQLLRGEHFNETIVFPRIVECELLLRAGFDKATRLSISVRCVLTLNMFIEKIYIFLALWFSILLVILSVDLFRNLLNYAFEQIDFYYIRHRLSLVNENEDHTVLMKLFSKKILRADGVMVLRLIERNSSIYLVNRIINTLWAELEASERRFLNVDEDSKLL